MSDFEKPEEPEAPSGKSSNYVRPVDWKVRADAWAEKAIPMPAWARTFTRTGVLPPESERQSNDSGLSMADREKEDADARYAAVWRGLTREMCQLKAVAAKLIITHGPDSPIGRAARQRGFDVDEEWQRLRIERDKRAPLHIHHFPPIDASTAGQSLAKVERAKSQSKSPLFDARRAAANDNLDDVVDSFGGV